MSKRCLTITIIVIAIILSIILLSFAMSTHASCAYKVINLENSAEISTCLINQTIDNYNPDLAPEQKTIICQSIITEADSNNFDPLFIAAVIAAESSFTPKAISPCAALGLMQITAGVIQIMHIENPFDIKENIYAGTKYLKELSRIFKNTELTLAAYNAGPTRVALLGRVPEISETVDYIYKVQQYYLAMQKKFRTTMLCSIIFPVCFKSEFSATTCLLAVSHECQTQTDGSNPNPETITAFCEDKRNLTCIIIHT